MVMLAFSSANSGIYFETPSSSDSFPSSTSLIMRAPDNHFEAEAMGITLSGVCVPNPLRYITCSPCTITNAQPSCFRAIRSSRLSRLVKSYETGVGCGEAPAVAAGTFGLFTVGWFEFCPQPASTVQKNTIAQNSMPKCVRMIFAFGEDYAT